MSDEWDYACHRCGQIRCGCASTRAVADDAAMAMSASAARWVVDWNATPQWNRWPLFLAMGISMRGWLQSLKGFV